MAIALVIVGGLFLADTILLVVHMMCFERLTMSASMLWVGILRSAIYAGKKKQKSRRWQGGLYSLYYYNDVVGKKHIQGTKGKSR